MKVAIFHPSVRSNLYTQLQSDQVSGVNSLSVKNTAGFVTTKPLILGQLGFQQTEVVKPNVITAPATITLTGGNTAFSHNADTRIYQADYDQIKVYLSTTGITGVYTIQPNMPINITYDQDMTLYEDTASQPTYYYKYSFFNSISSAESDMSDPIAATGFSFYSLKTMIDRVLSLFGDANAQYVSRNEVRDYLNERYEKAQKDLAIATKRVNIKTNTFTVALQQEEYSNALAADFLMEKGIRVSTDGGVTFPYRALNGNVDSLGSNYQTNIKYKYYIYGSTIGLDPIPQNATDILKIYYVPLPFTLSLQTDLLNAPFQNSSDMFVRGALAMAYLKDRKMEEYSILLGNSNTMIGEFISFMKKMQNLHPAFTEIMDASFV